MEDVLPNNLPLYATLPEDRVEKENQAEAEAYRDLPLLENVMSWFDEQIKRTDSIESIMISPTVKAEDIRCQLLAQKQLKILLQQKQAELKAKIQLIQDKRERGTHGQ
nr:MAG TPA: hypothetical protein [Caudoviricetes sp.]